MDQLSGLTLDGFADAVHTLVENAIVVVLTIYRDAAGDRFVQLESFSVVTEASAAPVYSVYSRAIGADALGGHVDTFESIGEATGSLALAVVEDPATAPRTVETPGAGMVDWRQVLRFAIDPALLPERTVRRFYTATGGERYRLEILGVAVVIFLQAATIAALLVQERRRKRIAGELAAGRLELAQASRAAQLGELSGALAHELNQPLASILANAEAGSRLLRAETPDLGEVSEILSDIADDDRRAAGIIAELRRLMLKGETDFQTIDLDDIVERTLALARGELAARGTAVDFRPGVAGSPVRANGPQIQQVVLNLMLNAVDAMAELAPEERRIAVATEVREDLAGELRVADRGSGLTPEAAAAAFRPFVSTNLNGLGLGLSICHSIAEAHGGSLDFDGTSETGATILLTLPAPREREALT